MAIEAIYGLTVLDSGDQPLTALEFGDVVQGGDAHASFVVRNDGNVPVKLGLRMRHSDTIYEATEACTLPWRGDLPSTVSDLELKLRKEHLDLHGRLGELDTDEKVAVHKRFHANLAEKLRRLTHSVVKGHRITVPDLASFCFVVAPGHPDAGAALPPGGKVPVAVGLRAHPDVALGLHQFTVLVDANDRDP